MAELFWFETKAVVTFTRYESPGDSYFSGASSAPLHRYYHCNLFYWLHLEFHCQFIEMKQNFLRVDFSESITSDEVVALRSFQMRPCILVSATVRYSRRILFPGIYFCILSKGTILIANMSPVHSKIVSNCNVFCSTA